MSTKRKKTPTHLITLSTLLLSASAAMADAPLIYCEGAACGGHGDLDYVYRVDSESYPMLEFQVGTNDLDPAHYRNIAAPEGWSFTVLDAGTSHAHGVFTEHGELSPGPCYCLTAGTLLWWTDDPGLAVESFAFGFDHGSSAEDLGWELLTRRAGPPPEYYHFEVAWNAAHGSGEGPLHGPDLSFPVLHLDGEEAVEDSGIVIEAPGYSVPIYTLFDGDDLPDLLVGEGGAYNLGKVRIYPNLGSLEEPHFSGFSYVQSNGSDLGIPGSGCLGIFPRILYWDADARKDLLVGLSSGEVSIYLNIGTNEDPTFDGGTYLQVGQAGQKVNINVNGRATTSMVDWDRDGRRDLVSGALDGRIHIFINEGSDTAPDFLATTYAQTESGDLVVPTERSSPVVGDFNGDRRRDLLCGNTEGQLLLYENLGSDEEPLFGEPMVMSAGGEIIDIEGTGRSRPSVCDWDADGLTDVLIGAGGGLVRLYRGLELTPYLLSADPNPLIAGQNVTVTLTGATPFTNVAGGFSFAGLGNTYLPFLDVSVDLRHPRLGGIEPADENGTVTWTLYVPPIMAGRALWLQSAEWQRKSHVIVTNIN